MANWQFASHPAKNAVEIGRFPMEYEDVKVAAAKKQKNEAELMDHATNNLLRALKGDMQKNDGRVDSDKLRKEGYSERLIIRLEKA